MKLTFGTGGLRAVMGENDDQMNLDNIRLVTRAVAMYLKLNAGSCEKPKVAIAYDSRINSEEFARETARILALEDCDAWIYPKLSPTPTLSFAVRYLQCDLGICITASHNPKEYNGYKVYGSDGCQITEGIASAISACIEKTESMGMPENEIAVMPGEDFETLRLTGQIHFIEDAVMKAFLKEALSKRTRRTLTSDLCVVYTPLHGAGLLPVVSILKHIGVHRLQLVTEQAKPDGEFPTCAYPNPENPDAMALGLEYCKRFDADLMIATDPDSDRAGVAAKKGDTYEILSGNQVGVLLLDYLLSCKQDGEVSDHPVLIKTVVTTAMADKMALSRGIQVINTLTGFKYIGEQIGMLEKQGRVDDYLFGFEESCGYLIGSYVRDKDAVGASMLICEMADALKEQGKTMWQRLEELYAQYGRYETAQKIYPIPVEEAKKRMAQIRSALQTGQPMKFEGALVTDYTDYLPGIYNLPPADVLELILSDGSRAILRPSGTEPKLKVYLERVYE